MTDMAADTDSTGTSMERATRSAGRWRVPVSVVGMAASGMRCTLARAMREASEATMIAPSILASSLRRWGLNSESSRKPPEQIESTSGPSPITTRPPRLARRMRSRPSRKGRPGATMPSASLMAAFWRVITRESYLAPPGRTGGRRSPTGSVEAAESADRLGHRIGADQLHTGWALRGRRRNHHPGESESGGLVEAPGEVGDLAYLTGQSDLAHRRQVGGQRHSGGGGGHGEGQRQIGGRLRDPDATGHRREDVDPVHGEPGMAGQYGQGHHQPTAVETDHGPFGLGLGHRGDQGLEFDHQGPSALECRKYHPTGHPGQPVAEEQAPRIVDPVESLLPHLEQSELAGRPETVLDGQEEAEGVVAVTLEAQHRVDHVLERPRTGQGAVFGDVADQHGGHLAGLGQADELVGTLPNLADRPRHPDGASLARRGRTDGHRLDGVDHEEAGVGLDHGVDDLADVGG